MGEEEEEEEDEEEEEGEVSSDLRCLKVLEALQFAFTVYF